MPTVSRRRDERQLHVGDRLRMNHDESRTIWISTSAGSSDRSWSTAARTPSTTATVFAFVAGDVDGTAAGRR